MPLNILIPYHKFRNISIVNKLYFVVGVMALLIAMELLILVFSINTLSAVRAYVGAEGLWSKAQKDALYNLQKYTRYEQEEYYNEFLRYLKIPLGDRIARIEMTKKNPDYEIMRKGFIEGGIHPDDINGMLMLFIRFQNISYIHQAIDIWTQGDLMMVEFQNAANELHTAIQASGILPAEILDLYLAKNDEFNKKFTILENEFSATLSEGSRWLEALILKILLSIALTVEISGLLLTITLSRNISKDIGELLKASEKIAKGDFSSRATVNSNDEIGRLAISFNSMTDELEHNITEIEHRTADLSNVNKELMAFTYIASHDLQEPLRKIQLLANRILEKDIQLLSENGKNNFERIQSSAGRMQQLIEDLLAFSRINTTALSFEKSDIHAIIEDIITEMGDLIYAKHAVVESSGNCLIPVIPFQFRQLMSNLISNSLKFARVDVSPVIRIHCRVIKGMDLNPASTNDGKSYCHISVEDNGIGFDQEYSEKIFEVFQKLHSKEEYPGTGIGLAIVKKIVHNHHGRIIATGKPDQGAMFDIYFPA